MGIGQEIEYLVSAIESLRELNIPEREQEFIEIELLLLKAIEELANRIIMSKI